jgi:hypothetical protein
MARTPPPSSTGMLCSKREICSLFICKFEMMSRWIRPRTDRIIQMSLSVCLIARHLRARRGEARTPTLALSICLQRMQQRSA